MKQSDETLWNSNEKQLNSMKQRSETPWSKNQYKKIDISLVTVHDSRCFIGMKRRVSWPWNTVSSWFKMFHDHETVLHPDSRCFMTMFHLDSTCFTPMKQIVSLLIHPDSTCFTLFHDHERNCFIADSSWFNMFHHCFLALIHPVSCWFDLFHHCLTSGNEPLEIVRIVSFGIFIFEVSNWYIFFFRNFLSVKFRNNNNCVTFLY